MQLNLWILTFTFPFRVNPGPSTVCVSVILNWHFAERAVVIPLFTQEVGEPKCRKTEVRMPWLITDERPQLTPVLADVLQSTRPENLNEAKRRKLSRTDSIPSPVVFDAKYHFTITVCVKDINSSSKLVYQITCIRAMAFANGTQPAPELENNSVSESHLIGTNRMPTSKTRKKKGFSLCGLNCMGGKDKEEMDENRDSYPSRRSVDYTQCHLSVAEVAPSQNVQVVEPPSPPQRRRSSSINKQAITGEGDIAKPNCSVQSSADTNLVASTPNVLVCSESHKPMLNTTSFLSENSTSVNLSRYLTYTKSDATGQFLNEPQITSTCTPHQSQVEQAVKSTLSSFEINAPKPSHESIPNEVPQLLLPTATEKKGTTAPGLMSPKSAENVDDCTGRAQPSPVPSPKKREMSVTPSSPGRPSASPHSGIPLPRNPTRAMVGTAHHPPSPSGEVAEIEASGHSNEATLDLQAAAIDLTTALGEAVNLDQTKSESPTSLPVPEVPVSTPTTAVPGSQNGTTKTDISTPAPIATPPPMQLAQTRRPSGLIGPKVVVNKPGISVYKGRNAPSLSSPVEMGPDGDSPNGGPITTPTLPVAPTAATVAVSAKSSNIRPPMVTTEANVTRYHPRSSIPTRSTLATRNGHDSPSTGSLQAVSVRSAPTGIRMPSQLSRQTLAKVTLLAHVRNWYLPPSRYTDYPTGCIQVGTSSRHLLPLVTSTHIFTTVCFNAAFLPSRPYLAFRLFPLSTNVFLIPMRCRHHLLSSTSPPLVFFFLRCGLIPSINTVFLVLGFASLASPAHSQQR
ncbi:hypothetical protein EGR_02972 [Echinococcus granulosus]|uniref:Uncharacterized protein n=1 Tax=Echinococcus granulosus TaxID=6210 RepID=W6UL12_ECHGR|nr:hypothetical protein EGR_02972 [Echinococcus granulosus]EUB62220.1 hypothetical protein EGR_02972 [Echinococcus granulosus]